MGYDAVTLSIIQFVNSTEKSLFYNSSLFTKAYYKYMYMYKSH